MSEIMPYEEFVDRILQPEIIWDDDLSKALAYYYGKWLFETYTQNPPDDTRKNDTRR